MGFAGGHWAGNTFAYNTSVTNVNTTIVHNTYNVTVVNNVTVNKVSYNGGAGGVTATPTAQERAAAHLPAPKTPDPENVGHFSVRPDFCCASISTASVDSVGRKPLGFPPVPRPFN